MVAILDPSGTIVGIMSGALWGIVGYAKNIQPSGPKAIVQAFDYKKFAGAVVVGALTGGLAPYATGSSSPDMADVNALGTALVTTGAFTALYEAVLKVVFRTASRGTSSAA